jgi:putative FmdB family regulatory protein
MPTYQYACTSADCGLRFERVQAFTDPAISECPECNERVRKVYGSVGVVFKGSGFYRTDSREKAGSGAKSESAAKSGDAGKGSDGAASTDAGKAASTGSSGSGKATGESGSAAKAPAATTAS